jgi:hypothetical protein
VSQYLLFETPFEGGVVVEVFDGQTHHGDAAPLPLQVAVSIVCVAAVVAMVWSVDFDDHRPPVSDDDDVR